MFRPRPGALPTVQRLHRAKGAGMREAPTEWDSVRGFSRQKLSTLTFRVSNGFRFVLSHRRVALHFLSQSVESLDTEKIHPDGVRRVVDVRHR